MEVRDVRSCGLVPMRQRVPKCGCSNATRLHEVDAADRFFEDLVRPSASRGPSSEWSEALVERFGAVPRGEAAGADLFLAELLGESPLRSASRFRASEDLGFSEAMPDTAEATTTSARLTSRPTPGNYYQIQRGDTLLGIAGRAYGVPAGSQRLRLARLINDHTFNLRLRRPNPVNLFPQGIISFFPDFADAQAQLATRDGTPPRGNRFAVIFIPQQRGEPDRQGVSIGAGRASAPRGRETEDTEENLQFDLVVAQDVLVHATGNPTPARSFTWTSADPTVATVTQTDPAAEDPNDARIRTIGAGRTTVTVQYVAQSGVTSSDTVDVVVTAVPRPTRCRTFVPTATNTLVVAQREFAPPAGLTVTNWADPTVAHKDGTPARRPACREIHTITELIVHETASRTINRGSTGRPRVQLVLHRDGTFTQHADLAHDLPHANHHNVASFGFETVNPVLPRLAGAPDNGLPPDQVAFPVIQNTTWTGQDVPVDDNGRAIGPARNRSRHYVRPTDAQLESATRLIEWATDRTVGHGMDIPQTFLGLRGSFMLFGRDDPLFTGLAPGIYAHGYFEHSDGFFIVLYAWLRLERGMTAQNARDTAIDLAANHVARRRERQGARHTSHANLTHILTPPTP